MRHRFIILDPLLLYFFVAISMITVSILVMRWRKFSLVPKSNIWRNNRRRGWSYTVLILGHRVRRHLMDRVLRLWGHTIRKQHRVIVEPRGTISIRRGRIHVTTRDLRSTINERALNCRSINKSGGGWIRGLRRHGHLSAIQRCTWPHKQRLLGKPVVRVISMRRRHDDLTRSIMRTIMTRRNELKNHGDHFGNE